MNFEVVFNKTFLNIYSGKKTDAKAKSKGSGKEGEASQSKTRSRKHSNKTTGSCASTRYEPSLKPEVVNTII